MVWYRLEVLGPDETKIAGWTVEGAAAPDLAAIDEIASALLWAKQLGGRLVLSGVSREMRELIELAALPVEVAG